MEKIFGLLRLYRADSFLITVLSFFITLIIIGIEEFPVSLILLGLSLGVVFVNFVYSINSYFDASIDAINKPHRPIPSGIVSKNLASKYILFLGALSILLPLFFANTFHHYIILYSFSIIGILYSNPYFPLKRIAPIATFTTSLLLLLPAAIAVIYANRWADYWQYLLLIFLYCLCLVPLKDIEDVEGDVTYNSGNWSNIIGERKLVICSLTGILTLALLVIVFRHIPGIILLEVVLLSAAIVEGYYIVSKKPLSTLYGVLIRTNIILLIIGTLVLFIWNNATK
jgi:4-hydroxybenzoate polyprenyltransferase